MSLQHPGRSALFLSLSLIAAAAAQAADSNLYLQLGGNPAILGESTAKGHVGAIHLDSLQWASALQPASCLEAGPRWAKPFLAT